MTRVIFSSSAFIQAVPLDEWTADATIATVFRRVLGVALRVHESYINITSVEGIDASTADSFRQRRKLSATAAVDVLSISYTSSLPIPVTTTADAVFDQSSAYLTSPAFSEYFYFAMQASPLFRANEATAYVNAAGGMSLVDTSFVTVITKSPGPTGQPTGSPTRLPSSQPTNTPTGPPVVIPIVPLLSPAQVQILTISVIALGAGLAMCVSAYLLFFRCYLVDRHKAAGKALGKKTAFVLQLPAEVAEVVVVEKGPARILNKKERAKLREAEREKRDQLAAAQSSASPVVAATGEGDEEDEELDGSAGEHTARPKAGLWSCFGRQAAAPGKEHRSTAPRARYSHRIYVAPGSHDEEHKDRWSDEGSGSVGGTQRQRKKKKSKPLAKRKKGGVGGPETDDEDGCSGDEENDDDEDKEAPRLAAPRPLVDSNDDASSGGKDSWNVQFVDLPPPKAAPLKIKQINPQQLTRKEKLLQKRTKEVADKLRALERAIQLGEEVEWSQVNEDIDGTAAAGGGGKALQGPTQEERRKLLREANQAREANARKEMAIESVRAAYERRQQQAVVHLVTPQVSRRHEFPDAETSQSLFDADVDGRRKEVVARRLQARLEWREARMRAGEEDVVLRNAGPPMGIVPPGFSICPVAPPVLKLEALYHRRVMVHWNEEKARGWFLGTVCSSTTRPGYNFGVKYDRLETQNIDVDGIKTAMLGMEGGVAYGLHWVLLDPMDGVVAPVDLPLDSESFLFDDMV